MNTIYLITLILHLLCTIIFVGYLFFEVIIYPSIRKTLDKDIEAKVTSAVKKGDAKMPLVLLMIFITGLIMLFRYVGNDVGFFTNNMQKMLMLKVLLASIIFAIAAFSMSCAYIFKRKNPIAKIVHPIVLLIAFLIIIIAKLMFYV